MFKKFRLAWADKLALVLAFLVATAAFAVWVSGMVGLEGFPHPRFDQAMLDWTFQTELMLVLPSWILLRAINTGARMLGQLLRSSLGRVGTGGLQASS